MRLYCIIRKLVHWQGSISAHLYCLSHFPLLREASPRSLTWVLSGCSAPAQQRHPPFMTTTIVVPGVNHVSIWINPHSIMATKAQSSTDTLPETGLHQTPESLRCHHFVAGTHPGSNHARRCLTCVIKRNTLLHHQKVSSLVRQYKFPLILSATIKFWMSQKCGKMNSPLARSTFVPS
jgi:hypothetical protein